MQQDGYVSAADMKRALFYNAAFADRFHSKCGKALEWFHANELEVNIKSLGKASTPQRRHGQSASLECGRVSRCIAGPLGCSLLEDPAGPYSLCVALLPVQGLQTLAAPGKLLAHLCFHELVSTTVWSLSWLRSSAEPGRHNLLMSCLAALT